MCFLSNSSSLFAEQLTAQMRTEVTDLEKTSGTLAKIQKQTDETAQTKVNFGTNFKQFFLGFQQNVNTEQRAGPQTGSRWAASLTSDVGKCPTNKPTLFLRRNDLSPWLRYRTFWTETAANHAAMHDLCYGFFLRHQISVQKPHPFRCNMVLCAAERLKRTETKLHFFFPPSRWLSLNTGFPVR